MHHRFRPIDLDSPSLCPSQLAVQENRKTGGVWVLEAGPTKPPDLELIQPKRV